MPQKPVPPTKASPRIGIPAHQPLDIIGNLQAIGDASRRTTPSALLQLLPTSNELIKTSPQQNYGIPTDSSIRPMAPQDYTRQAGTQSAIDMASGFAMPTVYHGSPHLFDRFDMSKIGTGEGAQAYGHGLYFAENPTVAKSYQMIGPRQVHFDGTLLDPYTTPELYRAPEGIAKRRVILNRSVQDTINELKDARDAWSHPPANTENAKIYNDALNWLNQNQHRFEIKPSGGFYETHIPDEAADKMLHWDKPLNEQHPKIQAAIDQLIDDLGMARVQKKWTTGQGFYKQLSQRPVMGRYGDFLDFLGKKGASEELAKRGIPGIQYFDQGSRAAQKGTRNFVVFDPSILGPVARK